jgi:transposase
MKRLREAVRRKRPDLCWGGKKWLLHHDNAPAHSSLLIYDFLTQHNTTLIPQPLYLPDLTSTDFFLFTQLKSVLKGQCFESVQEIKGNSLEELRNIPQEAFQECLQNWKKCWEQCIKTGEEYVARDKAQ